MNPLTFDPKRPISWSAISSFEYDPERWYKKYVLKREEPASKEMLFGKTLGERLASDPSFLPQVKRYPVFEYELGTVLEKIPLIGFADGWDKESLTLGEYKTGKKAWDQKRADEHGQLTMYCLFLYLTEHIKPELVTCELHWLPTEDRPDFSIALIDDSKVHTFTTTRTTRDVLEFGVRITQTYAAMQRYCKNHD